MKLSFEKIRGVGPVALIAGGSQILLTVTGGFALSYLLGFSLVPALILGIALTFSSTVIVVKLLVDNRATNKPYGQIAIGVLVAGDWGSPRERVVAFLLLFAVVTSGVSNLADIAQGVLGGALALVHLTGDRFRPIAALALIAGALASYVLGDSITQFSTCIGVYLFALGVGAWLSGFLDRSLERGFIEIEMAVALLGGFSAPLLFLSFSHFQREFYCKSFA